MKIREIFTFFKVLYTYNILKWVFGIQIFKFC